MISDFELLNQPAVRHKKEKAENLFVAEGFKIINRAILLGYQPRAILTSRKWLPQIEELNVPDVETLILSDFEIEQIVGYNVHRGVLASFDRKPPRSVSEVLLQQKPVVLLENLVDLENVGTIFRTAAAFGFNVLLGPNAPDPYYRRIIKSSMAAVLSVPHARLENLQLLKTVAPSRAIVGMSLQAKQKLNDYQVQGNEILTFGSEGTGISPEMRKLIDVDLIIPISDAVDSLNVSAAASITLWHFSQRV